MAYSLPSPPASAASPSLNLNDAVNTSSELPAARRHPLRPGSQKEIALIGYLDDKILRIQRRYGKKFTASRQHDDDTPGYTSFDEIMQDLDPLIDVAWVSGTTSLQIPYLLSLAGIVVSYLPAFPFSPSTFRTLRKLDRGFATLLRTRSADVNGVEISPVSRTDKVRIKSLAEDTRVVVVNAAAGMDHSAPADDFSSDDDSADEGGGDLGGDVETDHDGVNMNLGQVYKRTLEILGDELT